MTQNEIEQALAVLKKSCGFFEASHKTSFECSRKLKDGNVQKVMVDVFDAGPDVDPGLRYYCEAKREDGIATSGNSGETPKNALAVVHWGKLDALGKA